MMGMFEGDRQQEWSSDNSLVWLRHGCRTSVEQDEVEENNWHRRPAWAMSSNDGHDTDVLYVA